MLALIRYKVKTENSVDTVFSSKSMPKTKESYIRSQGKTPADIIKTPDRAKAVPKQNTHTVTRNASSNAKKAVKTKDSLSNGASRWDLVLAVFATKVAGVEDDTVEDVVVITEEKKQKLKDVFWDMHEITSQTETVTNGETSEKVILMLYNKS